MQENPGTRTPESLERGGSGSNFQEAHEFQAFQVKVVLLTKVDLTEFEVNGRLGQRGVAECVRWPAAVRPRQHVAQHDTLEATLWHDMRQRNTTLNPKP